MAGTEEVVPQRCVKCEGRATLFTRHIEDINEMAAWVVCDEKKCKYEREVRI